MMTNQDKYDWIIDNYKSLGGAILIIKNKNLYEIYKNYDNKIPKFGEFRMDPKDHRNKFFPQFTNDLILLVNLMYKELSVW